ncbi:hypothetical protein A5821_003259 [Enterococcus sp. 7F3_DIV0205]|uniref:Uncharacterized protein n=1 Tax=Candidatus Enterococcus palustris TaxID=1834189 RepID=A0AAQ3WDL5_9ENTE|nr:hypothetical protein [Enterococcus sp. 7F3_DIV0205]OTN84141.1 hypothetical protein A5821_000067 [Enterococcus sp. 7F3_DIV0205]
MTSDDKLRWLAEQSYWVDTGKEDKPYIPKEYNDYDILIVHSVEKSLIYRKGG